MPINNTNINFGVDLGLMTQLESLGFYWVNDDNKKVDPVEELKRMGADTVRLRLFVNPPESAELNKAKDETCYLGYCNTRAVIDTALRVTRLGMKVMLDFHYSDFFADLFIQEPPESWKSERFEDMCMSLYDYTVKTLAAFKDAGIYPEYVQTGNEINNGILFPEGDIRRRPKQFVRLLNTGYDSVKKVFNECMVVTHIAGLHRLDKCMSFFGTFFRNGGKTDVLGLSYFPYWVNVRHDKDVVLNNLNALAELYDKPVMVCETGGADDEADETYKLLYETAEAMIKVSDGMGKGVFYWEPEVNREALPDKYPLGACRLGSGKRLSFTKVMSAYRNVKLAYKKEDGHCESA